MTTPKAQPQTRDIRHITKHPHYEREMAENRSTNGPRRDSAIPRNKARWFRGSVLHIQPHDNFNISNVPISKSTNPTTQPAKSPEFMMNAKVMLVMIKIENQADEAYQIPAAQNTAPATRRSQTQPFGLKISTADS
jgi:hypothetical protein